MGRPHRQEFAVIGLGRFGLSLAISLAKNGHNVLGIDKDKVLVQRASQELTRVVMLDSTDEQALKAVDITSFDQVVVAIGSDFESNLLTTAVLKDLGVKSIVCKTTTKRQRDILLRMGADRVVLPEYEAGQRLARSLIVPGALDMLDLGPGYSVVEVRVPQNLIGQTLVDSDLRRGFNLIVLAVRRSNETVVIPQARFTLNADDTLVLVGPTENIHRFMDVL
jgi:trk system potassium uptake protein TrkA